MLDWFRSWHGAPTDPKWLVIAKRAGVPAISVSAIAWALFDHASQAEDRGSVEDFDFETYSALMGADEEQVRAVYAAMEAKAIIVAGRIAQWDKRQPKREDSSSERMKEVRKKKEAQPSLPLSNNEERTSNDAEQSNPPASAGPALAISPEAIALADEVAVIAGHDIKFVPPAWCGAASRVQMWLTAGWPRDLIVNNIAAQMQRKRDGPPDRIKYFERGIAQAIAERSAPLPTIVPIRGDTSHVRNGKAQSPITAAVDRIIADLEAGGGALREDSSRLLSDGRRQ